MNERLETLSKLQPGWLDGKGRAPTRNAVCAAQSFLDAGWAIFPTPEGGIQIERMVGAWALEITFGPEPGEIEIGADVDVFAFAFLDLRTVAYLSIQDMKAQDGSTKQVIDWRTIEQVPIPIKHTLHRVRLIEEFARFPL